MVVSNGGANGFEISSATNSGTTSYLLSYNRSTSAYTDLRFDASAFRFEVSASEKARIDSSGRLLVGTTTNSKNLRGEMSAAIVGVGANTNAGLGITGYCGTYGPAYPLLDLQRSRGVTDGSMTVVTSGDKLGILSFRGADGDNFITAASIEGAVDDGTVGANRMPGRLVFSTATDASPSVVTPRMTIRSDGTTLIGKTTGDDTVVGIRLGPNAGDNCFTVGSSASWALMCNRQGDDGTLILFRQANTDEGSISVSGTTVSYNGAHLSRWSQLPSGAERIEILRGSVLSNLDEMCEWGEEDNEQLNRMKVSTVEGDKNVSGVFQSWDDDDDTYTNDFYCAMTGDFIIRIAEGATVERGDLLMSAGDGTAKPQDNDIIRSKTIAKVTSTNVTCTYDDGSYCVPCVLMAC